MNRGYPRSIPVETRNIILNISNIFVVKLNLKNKYVAYSSQENHTI